MMKRTWVELLLELPVDATLRGLVHDCGLAMPASFVWTDSPQASKALLEAAMAWPEMAVRDRLAARLHAGAALADGPGKQAMFEACSGNAAALAGLATCQSDLHRSFWLYVKHPDLFDRAGDLDHFERHGAQAQQHDLGVTQRPSTSLEALVGLRSAISDFYQRELRCGERCHAYLVERSPGIFLLSVHVKDLAMLQLEFEGDDLKRRVGHPDIHSVLEYSQATGVARTLVRGGIKYHQMLIKAFCEHLLGQSVDAQRLRPPSLDLSKLRAGFDVPQAINDGFVTLQVKSLTVLSPSRDLKLVCTATASSAHRCVTDLLEDMLPTPLRDQWYVAAAQINLYYPPEFGRSRSKVVSVEVTSKGRLNLHKFDARLQAQLEGYLVTLGILQDGQTLAPQAITGDTHPALHGGGFDGDA